MLSLRGLLLFLLTVTVACSPPAQEPRAIRPESDVCQECRMTVLPNGYAAEAVDTEGLVTTFDDVGCLAVFVHDHADRFRGARFFVQDAETRAWVALEAAQFVRADEVATPMNYGWHAFATVDAASRFAVAQGGTVTTPTLAELMADVEPRRWQP